MDVSQSAGELQLTRSNMDRIKEQLSKEVLSSIDGMMSAFGLKLRDIEHRVSVIEGKLSERLHGLHVPSGSKGKATDVGNQSPSPFSNFGTASKNKYGDNYNTPPPSDRKDELGLRLEDLENEVQRSQKSESSLKHRLADYQTRLGDKDSEIEKLEGEVRRLKNDLRAAQTLSNNVLSDSQSKNRMLEENISLKQSLTGLSA